MVEEERAKGAEAPVRQLIQIQTGDIEVAKLQLAARWAEMATATEDVDAWLKVFSRAYKSIDEALRV
jgi:hypothetical protein